MTQVTASNTDFWEAFRRHFPSPLSYSAVVSIKALSTNQKDESGSIAPPLPFSLWVWLLLSHWRTCQAVSLRTRRSRVPRTGSGWRVPCLQSEPHTHVIGSIYLLTFARPRQRENTKCGQELHCRVVISAGEWNIHKKCNILTCLQD